MKGRNLHPSESHWRRVLDDPIFGSVIYHDAKLPEWIFKKDNHYTYSEKTGSHLVFFEILVPSKSRSHSGQTCFLSNVHVESLWGNARGIPHGDDEKKRNKISSPFLYPWGASIRLIYGGGAIGSFRARYRRKDYIRKLTLLLLYSRRKSCCCFSFVFSWWMMICSLNIFYFIRLAVYSHRSRLIMWLADYWSPFGTFILA